MVVFPNDDDHNYGCTLVACDSGSFRDGSHSWRRMEDSRFVPAVAAARLEVEAVGGVFPCCSWMFACCCYCYELECRFESLEEFCKSS